MSGITISADQFQRLGQILSQHPTDILLSEPCRRFLAQDRWVSSTKALNIHETQTEGVMPGTVTHNRAELDQNIFGSSRRSQRLLNPLSGLEPVYSAAGNLKVLSIGPRTEMELFHLMALGFRAENISALDLISSSPMIQAGDMHAMPYPDRSFDVVISSWVLNYSKTPQLAVDEMKRVCVPGGLIAIGLTYAPARGHGTAITDPGETNIIGSMQRSAGDLLALLGDRVSDVHYQSTPPRDDVPGPVMVIARMR